MTRRSLLLRDFPEALSSRSENKMSDTAGRLERDEATDGERIRHQGRESQARRGVLSPAISASRVGPSPILI